MITRKNDLSIYLKVFLLVSEGTSEEEDLEEPVTVLQPDFFNKRYDDTTTLFRQYFKAIK